MALFQFPYHVPETSYPDTSTSLKFGGGYQFAAAPNGPDQLSFILNFQAMWYWHTPGGVISDTINRERNALALQQFYELHRMHVPFEYMHPIKGLCKVRFEKPMPRLKMIKEAIVYDRANNSRGHQVEPFEIQLIQQL